MPNTGNQHPIEYWGALHHFPSVTMSSYQLRFQTNWKILQGADYFRSGRMSNRWNLEHGISQHGFNKLIFAQLPTEDDQKMTDKETNKQSIGALE